MATRLIRCCVTRLLREPCAIGWPIDGLASLRASPPARRNAPRGNHRDRLDCRRRSQRRRFRSSRARSRRVRSALERGVYARRRGAPHARVHAASRAPGGGPHRAGSCARPRGGEARAACRGAARRWRLRSVHEGIFGTRARQRSSGVHRGLPRCDGRAEILEPRRRKGPGRRRLRRGAHRARGDRGLRRPGARVRGRRLQRRRARCTRRVRALRTCGRHRRRRGRLSQPTRVPSRPAGLGARDPRLQRHERSLRRRPGGRPRRRRARLARRLGQPRPLRGHQATP
jgi:hypothetical protein